MLIRYIKIFLKPQKAGINQKQVTETVNQFMMG